MQTATMECPGVAFTLEADSKPEAAGSLPTAAHAPDQAFMKSSESRQDISLLHPITSSGRRTDTDFSLFLS